MVNIRGTRVNGYQAEALAKRIALSAVEKDIPAGVELSLSATQIDCIPPEIENRVPDFFMEGNNRAQDSEEELAAPGKAET
jgi:hypothetical protein